MDKPPTFPGSADAATSRATLPEGGDAVAHILERLEKHGARHSRYQSRGEIARGGMGLILRVWDEDLRRELAMKVVLGERGQAERHEIPPKVLGRFLEEAQVTGQLDHPGIVPVHELGLDERGAVFFTMRLVRGRDLKEIFERVHAGDPDWTTTRVLWVLLKVCDAMAYAHAKGVVHRDLKPANVMVGRFGEVYVMDWGLARVQGQPDRHDLRVREQDTSLTFVQSERRADASHSADSVLFTMDGDVVGTPAYMAPEQARGEIEQLGPRSDVYALGAMLYHLLTGQMPFVSPGAKLSQHVVLRWVLEGPPKPVESLRAGLPEELVAICEKAMARDAEERYADMGELASDLRAYLENRVVRAHRGGAWVELRKWVQRNRGQAIAWASAAAVALAGLGATALVQVRGRHVAEDAMALAQANELTAKENLAEAERQEAIARRERANVLRLSAFQELDDLERDAALLWPAVPERAEDYRAWLARAERLLAGLEPDADGASGHRAQLAALRARALPLDPAERARRIAEHPRGAELLRAEREVAARAAAAAVRAGTAQVPVVDPDPELVAAGATALNERAFALVDPERTEFGREAEGLALARAAFELASPGERSNVLDTLAWALVGVGLDDEALEASREALDTAPPGARLAFEEYLGRVAHAVQRERGPEAGADLAAAEERLELLQREVLGTREPRFESEDDAWWYGQLATLVRRLDALADPRHGLVRGLSPVHGWGIERRLRYVERLEERSRRGAEARALWSAAVAGVRADERYAGLDLAPQLGLLPLGPDPESGLQEFADLASGIPVERGADGRLVLEPESAVVFVLVPGGAAEIGAQAGSASAPAYDPDATEDESPVHAVALDPFLVSKYELTQGQWQRLTGRNPSKNLELTVTRGRETTELSPVEQVTWGEAVSQLARFGWLLPTEAQWEYAARGGIDAPWWTGPDAASLDGAANLCDRFAGQAGAPWPSTDEIDDGYLVHAPVGSFAANPFGLHDVIGNVYEWCRDDWVGYAKAAAPGDGLRSGGYQGSRVVRGGSYRNLPVNARVSRRDSAAPATMNEAIGLRPVRRIAR